MSETTKLDERINNRVKRRWKRRARIVAPFAALPLLLGTLVMSIDFIEYAPQESNEKKLATQQVQQAATRSQLSIAARAANATSAVVSQKELFEKTGPAVNGLSEMAKTDQTKVRPGLDSVARGLGTQSPSTSQ